MQKKTNLPEYTDSEICSIYRNQVDKFQGVKVLKELTGWSEKKLIEILKRGGYNPICKEPSGTSRDIKQVTYDELYFQYAQGLSDNEVGKVLNVPKHSVASWRVRNKLPANQAHNRLDKTQALVLYQKNYSDERIAQLTGVSLQTVRKWRQDSDLPTITQKLKEAREKCL